MDRRGAAGDCSPTPTGSGSGTRAPGCGCGQGSGATSGRDVFPGTADSEIWLIDKDDPLLDRADPFARRVFRDPHPLDDDPGTSFDNGNGKRIMLGSHGREGTARDSTVLLPPATGARHADARRGRRAVSSPSTSTASRSSRPRSTAGRGPVDERPAGGGQPDRRVRGRHVQRGEPVRLPRRPVRRLRLHRQHRLPRA